jgi:hypothetical protein
MSGYSKRTKSVKVRRAKRSPSRSVAAYAGAMAVTARKLGMSISEIVLEPDAGGCIIEQPPFLTEDGCLDQMVADVIPIETKMVALANFIRLGLVNNIVDVGGPQPAIQQPVVNAAWELAMLRQDRPLDRTGVDLATLWRDAEPVVDLLWKETAALLRENEDAMVCVVYAMLRDGAITTDDIDALIEHASQCPALHVPDKPGEPYDPDK